MADTSLPALRLERLAKRFGGVQALDGVDLEVGAGEIHGLVGENGCGKSTLVKLVAGVHEPDPGSVIELGGRRFTRLDPATAKAMGVQVVYQDFSLFPNLTVAENIAFDLDLEGLLRPTRRRRMRAIAAETLDRLGFALPLEARVEDLPIGERQIVAIARGLAARARILFMDEPTASLTRAEVQRLEAVVRRLADQGIAIVFVSHRLDEIVELAERVTVLRDGRKVGTFASGELDARRIGELMTGLVIEHRVRARPLAGAEPVLEVEGLARRGEFGPVSFVLHKGEVLGLGGLLGAGRTELALCLFGMTRPDAGHVRLAGRPVPPGSPAAAISAGLAYLSEDRLALGLVLRQSVEKNLVLASLERLANRFGWIDPGRRRGLAGQWVARLKVKLGSLDQPVQELSGGNQQRIVLGKWLATEPRVLILDSPTVGVDVANKQAIHELVRALAEQGMAILLISDETGELWSTCDRVLVLRRGRIVGELVPEEGGERALEELVYA